MTDFDRKKSTKSVGQLYPVLLSKDGRVIDGFHRLDDDSGWKTETLEHIDSEEKLLLARAISNWHRREVPPSEKAKWINGLAKIYQDQGCKIKGDSITVLYNNEPFKTSNQIHARIVEVTGISPTTIGRHLDRRFKQVEFVRTIEQQSPRIPASQRIETELGTDYVERHEAEVLEKALKDPVFIAKAAAKIVEIPIETIVESTLEKPEPLTPEQVEDIKEAYQETQDKITEMRKRPAVQERAKWFKMWSGMGNLLSVLGVLICPICEKPASTHLIFKCHPENDINRINKLVKEKLE